MFVKIHNLSKKWPIIIDIGVKEVRESLNLNRINNKRGCNETLQINPEVFLG